MKIICFNPTKKKWKQWIQNCIVFHTIAVSLLKACMETYSASNWKTAEKNERGFGKFSRCGASLRLSSMKAGRKGEDGNRPSRWPIHRSGEYMKTNETKQSKIDTTKSAYYYFLIGTAMSGNSEGANVNTAPLMSCGTVWGGQRKDRPV